MGGYGTSDGCEEACSRRHRRQLADQGQAAPVGARPVHRRRRDVRPRRLDDRGRLGRRDQPRQRPAGRLHPAPLRARLAGVARGAARRLRRRQPGRDRLRARAEPRERLPPLSASTGTRSPWSRRWRWRPTTRRSRIRRSRSARSWTRTRRSGGRRRTAGTSIEDADRGWRRVVASPASRCGSSRRMRSGRSSTAGSSSSRSGGGGIPVVADADGNLSGVAAVIDKDLASALLANTHRCRAPRHHHRGREGGARLRHAGGADCRPHDARRR